VVVRKAASPGIVEAITGFLADNALTRSWSDTADRQILGPLERMTVSDEMLREKVPMMVGESGVWDGTLNKVQVQALEALKGEAVNVAGVEEAVRASLRDPAFVPDLEAQQRAAQAVHDQAVGFFNSYAPDRAAQQRAAQVLMERSHRGMEEGWSQARAVLGSAPVAYSLVGAGGAMGTAAAMEAYDWWQSQQQAEKEKALPLQGGMAL